MRQSWIDRFTGARETLARLKTYGPVRKADNSYLLDLYNDLLAELDGYAMNMGALLLERKNVPGRWGGRHAGDWQTESNGHAKAAAEESESS